MIHRPTTKSHWLKTAERMLIPGQLFSDTEWPSRGQEKSPQLQ